MKNNIESIKLRNHMAQNNLNPKGRIIADNQRHIYSKFINGAPRQVSYIATFDPLEEDGPTLMCSYGLIDEKENYHYSSFKKR